jgi:hypothetical protein
MDKCFAPLMMPSSHIPSSSGRMGAVECCDSIKGTMEAEGVPLIDINGEGLSFWVHQELLELSMGGGLYTGVVYTHHTFDGTACTSTAVTQAHVEAMDDAQEGVLRVVANHIATSMTDPLLYCIGQGSCESPIIWALLHQRILTALGR